MMRICVVGAGAVGSCLAARAAAGGAEVWLLARGARLMALRAGPLRVEAPDRRFALALPATDDPAAVPPPDLVVVAVKATALPAVAPALRVLGAPVLFVGNGLPWWIGRHTGGGAAAALDPLLDPGGGLARATAGRPLAGGVIWAACTVLPSGTVRVTGAPGRMALGWPGLAADPAMARLAGLLTAGGLAADWRPDILDPIWHKLTSSVLSAALAVPAGLTMAEAARAPGAARLARALAAEMAALAQAAGHRPGFDVAEFMARIRDLPHKPSLLQDIERGAPAETDAQLAAPLRLAAALGCDMPVLAATAAAVLARTRITDAGAQSR